jgi:micrococcal nuclease
MATVDRVTDGDTIHVNLGGKDYTLRYIGMNAPESVAPDKPVEPGGPEASVANKQLVGGKTVYLEKDVSETDQYGRLLRYVWLKTDAGWVMVDRQLVLEGWALARDYPPDTKYHDTLFEAQDQAQAAAVGIWGTEFELPQPSNGGVHLVLPGATASPNCDTSYPTVCIPPPPPDLDCADIPYRQFPVVPPDDHHFDGDHDGIGCEPTPAPRIP